MQASVASIAQGARWVSSGWKLFTAAPFGWLGLVLAYWFLMTLVSLVPYAGVVGAAILVPGFSVGFMAAARSTENGERLGITHLFAGFRESARRELILGAIYLVCLVVVLGCSALVDSGVLARWMLTGKRPSSEELASGEFFGALVAAALIYLPVMMLYWFAPLLVAWRGASPAKALFYSFFACLLNWRAFLAYGAAVALVAFVIPFIFLSLALLIAKGEPTSAASFLFPLLLVLLPVLFASFYASYRDIFGNTEAELIPASPETEKPD